MQGHVGGMGLCSFVSFWSECFISCSSLCQEGLFFMGQKLLAGRRDGWTTTWNSETPIIYFLLYSEFSCGFTWSFPWGILTGYAITGRCTWFFKLLCWYLLLKWPIAVNSTSLWPYPAGNWFNLNNLFFPWSIWNEFICNGYKCMELPEIFLTSSYLAHKMSRRFHCSY